MSKVRNLLLARGYKRGIVTGALEKARNILREEAIKKVERKSQQRPVLAIQYNSRLPSITNIARGHWRTMVPMNPKRQEVFPDPPLVAYRVKSKLVRAKVPSAPPARPIR